MMIQKAFNIISCPVAVLIGVLIISLGALIAAFSSEAFLGLEPCVLCIYQRWPYAAVMLFAIIGLALKRTALPRIMVGLSGLSFLTNAGIAVYHSGIERDWWKSKIQGCSLPDFSGPPQSILENIMSAPKGNCSEIPWQDPLLGLSMANWNIVLCGVLGILCLITFAKKPKARSNHA